MYAYNALRAAADHAGLSLASIGRSMDKPSNYVNNNISRGSTPKADTLAAMLDVCGWSLVAMPSDAVPPDALVIDPPPREG